MSLYGPLVSVEDVRAAFETHLETWTPAYIQEIARQRDVDLVEFRGFTSSSSGDTLPVCRTACAGTDGTPTRHGTGTYSGAFQVASAAVVAGSTRQEATVLAGYYGTAIRAAVVQHPDLGGFASSIDWNGTALEEVGTDTAKAIVASFEYFTVYVDDLLDASLGPATPPVDPTADPGDFPAVDLVGEQIIRTPTNS